MEWVSFIVFLLIGLALGFFMGKKSSMGGARDDSLQPRLQKMENEKAHLLAANEAMDRQLAEKVNSEKILRDQAQNARESLARAEEKINAFDDAQKAARDQFKNLANELLKQNNEEFKEQSKESLKALLNPLDKQLNEFKTEITGFKAINQKMTSETENLTNALTSNVKAQGSWGEFVLERILEESGLEEGREYILQGAGLNLKSAEGNRQMPDVVINLPDKRHIVIDSKVSLNSFRDYQNATNDEARAQAVKAFIASSEKHIKDLGDKNYQGAYGLHTLDFVMLFMPIEAAYFLLISEREDMLQKAWDRGISIVSPSNLFPNLKTISYLWRLQKQNENADEIARLGGTIFDKVHGFLGDMQDVGKALEKAGEKHEEAVKKLSSGKGNVMTQAEKLKELGAKTNKSLPDMSQN